jgi:hypothetical protein
MAGPRFFPSAIAALLFALAPQPAGACDFAPRPASDAERHAREVFRRSSAIIDAQVVVAQTGTSPARLRPIRILKGPRLRLFLAAPEGSCDVFLTHRGERVRLAWRAAPACSPPASSTTGSISATAAAAAASTPRWTASSASAARLGRRE